MEEKITEILQKMTDKLGAMEPTAIEAFEQLVAREQLFAGLLAGFGGLILLVNWKLYSWFSREITAKRNGDVNSYNKDSSDLECGRLFICALLLVAGAMVIIHNLVNAIYPLASLLR